MRAITIKSVEVLDEAQQIEVHYSFGMEHHTDYVFKPGGEEVYSATIAIEDGKRVIESVTRGSNSFPTYEFVLEDLDVLDGAGAVVLLPEVDRVALEVVDEAVLLQLHGGLLLVDVDHQVHEFVVALGQDHVVVEHQCDREQQGGERAGEDHPVQRQPRGPHGRYLVFTRKVTERHQGRRQHGHWYDQCKHMSEAQHERLHHHQECHSLGQELVDEPDDEIHYEYKG